MTCQQCQVPISSANWHCRRCEREGQGRFFFQIKNKNLIRFYDFYPQKAKLLTKTGQWFYENQQSGEPKKSPRDILEEKTIIMVSSPRSFLENKVHAILSLQSGLSEILILIIV